MFSMSFLWAWQSPKSYRQALNITTLYFWTRWSQLDCSELALPVCLLSEVASCMFIQSCGGKPGRDRERRKTEAKTTFQFVWTRRRCELEEIGSVVPIGYLFLGHSVFEEAWWRRWSDTKLSSAVGRLLKQGKPPSQPTHQQTSSLSKRNQNIKQICIFQWTEMWTIW